MPYTMNPLACDPQMIKDTSERLIVSHYENNYGGAVKRLNTITTQLAELDFARVPAFVIDGLKREELVASNSMFLHELSLMCQRRDSDGSLTRASLQRSLVVVTDSARWQSMPQRSAPLRCSPFLSRWVVESVRGEGAIP